MLAREERIERVKKFKEFCLLAGFHEAGPLVFELTGPFTKNLTFCTLIHGNETGGIEVLLKLLEEIKAQKLDIKSNLRVMLGNVDAYFEDKRFLENDMNRSFGLSEHNSREELRARELEAFLDDSDVFIDLHQTIGPSSTPFFIFEYEERSYRLARHVHPDLPMVTNSMKRNFKGMTSTAYTIKKGGMGITVETGQKGIEDHQTRLGLDIARKAIETDFNIPLPPTPLSNTYSFHQIINNPDGSLELVRELNNFDPVKKGEIIATNAELKIISEVDGVILFPKYGSYAKSSMELAIILKPVESIIPHQFSIT